MSPMAIPLFELCCFPKDVETSGEELFRAVDTEKHTRTWVYEIREGVLWLTFWKRKLHEVTYQTPLKSKVGSQRRNNLLFSHYGDGLKWNEILDNGFGKAFRRSDLKRYALWSYAMDYVTFGTMDYHDTVKCL